jgi:hypothetical protein
LVQQIKILKNGLEIRKSLMYPWSFGGAPEVSEIGVTRDGKDIESCPGSKEKILLGTQQCDFCVIFY